MTLTCHLFLFAYKICIIIFIFIIFQLSIIVVLLLSHEIYCFQVTGLWLPAAEKKPATNCAIHKIKYY